MKVDKAFLTLCLYEFRSRAAYTSNKDSALDHGSE